MRRRRLGMAALLGAALAGCVTSPARTPAPAAPAAAAPPGTDIYLLALGEQDGELRVGAPRNLTDRAGYDNQPQFTPDGRALLYTSIREDGQADVYRYDLERGAVQRLTRTPESEYSPTPLPDGAGFSVVRVERDSTQRLWRFDADGTNPRLLLAELRPVGYHAWGDAGTLALFVLGEPPTLQLADVRSGRAEVVAENIGRSLQPVPGRRAISFVHKGSADAWWIRVLDLETREITTLAPTLPGAEDHAWTPAGVLLMGRGSTLYRWNVAAGEWQVLGELGAAGVREITRLAVSPRGDRLAVVGARGE